MKRVRVFQLLLLIGLSLLVACSPLQQSAIDHSIVERCRGFATRWCTGATLDATGNTFSLGMNNYDDPITITHVKLEGVGETYVITLEEEIIMNDSLQLTVELPETAYDTYIGQGVELTVQLFFDNLERTVSQRLTGFVTARVR